MLSRRRCRRISLAITCGLSVFLHCVSQPAHGDDPKPAEPLPKTPLAAVTTPYPDIPEAVTSFGAAIADGALYIYGGHKGDAHRYYQEAQANVLWSLDLKEGGKWKKLAKGPRLQGLAMVAHDGNLYRLGGFTAKNKDGEQQDLWSQASAARFDLKTKMWEPLPDLPEPRSSFDAAVFGDSIYVVGGWQMRGDKAQVWHKHAWELDLKSEPLKWTKLPDPPFQRRALAVAAHDGRLFAIGGMLESGKTTTEVHIYDPSRKEWIDGPSLPGKGMEGFGASAFATGGHLYTTTYGGSLLRYSDKPATWQTLARTERARFFHRMLPLSTSQLISVGGASMESGKFDKLDVIDVKQ